MYIRRFKNETFYFILFLVFLVAVLSLFWYFTKTYEKKILLLNQKYQNKEKEIIGEKETVVKSYENDLVKIQKENLALKLALEEKNKKISELQEIIKVLKKKNKILSLGFSEYRSHHKVLKDSKYKEINLDKKYRDYFILVKVKNKKTYTDILKLVFGKKWNNLSKTKRGRLIDLTRSLNRVQESRIKSEMVFVVPFSVEVLNNYAPFVKKIEGKEREKIKEKREKIVKKYWNDFGSKWGNEIFQKRANKDWHYYLKIDLKRQYFALYKDWELYHWGAISSGGWGRITPTGYFINLWQKQDWYSTKYESRMWNAVNFHPKGYFTHQEILPGYPASHGCVRMLKKDSKTIYDISLNEVFPIYIY